MKQKKIEFPHVLVLLTIMIFLACVLTYALPAGIYDVDAETNIIVPDSFHYITPTPVSPLKAVMNIQSSISGNGLVMSLLLILGASTEILVSSGAVESLVDTGIARFRDKSIIVVVPLIYTLMSLLGALCGNDSMIAYVTVGLVIAMKLKMDRLSAMSMFYLPYITGQAVGPTTAIILMAQSILNVEPLSGIAVRLFMWVVYTAVGCIYTTRYALAVSRDPSRSLLGAEYRLDTATDEKSEKSLDGGLDPRAVFAVLMTIGGYVLYAIGSKTANWSWPELTTCILLSSVLIGALYRMAPNKIAVTLMKGATKMGGVCLLVGVAKTIVYVLTAGNIIHTIANAVISIMTGMSASICAIGLFVFNFLFNLLVPSGMTKAALVLPVTMPIGDALGITRQVMSFIFQLGDGLTNCITPLSGPLMGAVAMAGVKYSKWLRYVIPVVIINLLIAGFMVGLLQMLQWS